MASKADVMIIWHGVGHHNDSLWQPELYKDYREPGVPWKIEAHRNTILLYKRYGTKGIYKLQYVSIDEQFADVLTKPLSRVKFEYFHDKLGVVWKDFPRKEK